MALAAEQVFMAAVAAAEGTRQAAKAAAFTTWAFTPANQVAYNTALSDADVAYQTAVVAAQNTSNLTLGVLGLNGPIESSNWASLIGMS
jgi:hypothetical protein